MRAPVADASDSISYESSAFACPHGLKIGMETQMPSVVVKRWVHPFCPPDGKSSVRSFQRESTLRAQAILLRNLEKRPLPIEESGRAGGIRTRGLFVPNEKLHLVSEQRKPLRMRGVRGSLLRRSGGSPPASPPCNASEGLLAADWVSGGSIPPRSRPCYSAGAWRL